MNGRAAAWWLARGAPARRAMKFVLGAVAVLGMLLFVSFSMSAHRDISSGTKMRVTVGRPHPWLVLEKLGPAGTNAVSSATQRRAESSVNILSSSFAAGMLATYSIILLRRIGRTERPQ